MKLILFDSFRSDKKTVLSVINWGPLVGDKIRYPTKDGEQLKTIPEICSNTNTSVCDFEDIDLKSSLHYWFDKNPGQYNKPLEIDYSIETGEVYHGSGWHLPLMIDKSGDTIKVKPVYN